MGGRALFVLTVATLLASSIDGSPSHPLGCADPDIISKGLKNVSHRDWNEISETSLPSMWPTEISALDCNSGACQRVGHEGRIINNKCECCETFYFQVDRGDGGNIKERLNSVVIHYSMTGSDEIPVTTRTFARAMGLSEADAATIRRETRQQFDWNVNQREVALLTVEVIHQGQMWRAYLFLAHHAI